jgi:hypothetical protein
MDLPTMSGNYIASQYLSPYSEATGKGYVTHAVTTGISSRLFEGITIAEFDKATVAAKGCTPVMFNSRGGVSVILREPRGGCGQVRVRVRVRVCPLRGHDLWAPRVQLCLPMTGARAPCPPRCALRCTLRCTLHALIKQRGMESCGVQVIVDGAFTKLFCKWDAAGSDRFVRNCTCYLAADLSALDPELPSAPPAGAAGAASAAGGAGSGDSAPLVCAVLLHPTL